MKRFWDERAREDAFYFVDNRLQYGSPDLDLFWAQGREDLDDLLSHLGIAFAADDEVVEVGCGVGRLTREIARRAATVDAIDVSEEMLSKAQELNPELVNVRWHLGDGESLAVLADGSADACFSHVVFQHIPDPAVTLGYVSEMGRVLRPGGWAAFQVSNLPAIHRPAGLLSRLGRRLRSGVGRAPKGQAHPAWRGSAIDLAELCEVAAQAGMDQENTHGEGTQFCLVLLRKRSGG